MKKFARKKYRKMFLEAIFSAFEKTFFRVSVKKKLSLLYMGWLAYKISHYLSANHDRELRCVICTGVTLFAPVLHFLHWCYTWTALLSANQNRVIFSCVLWNIVFVLFICFKLIDIWNKPRKCTKKGHKNAITAYNAKIALQTNTTLSFEKTSSVTPIFYYWVVISMIRCNFLQSLTKILRRGSRATVPFRKCKVALKGSS